MGTCGEAVSVEGQAPKMLVWGMGAFREASFRRRRGLGGTGRSESQGPFGFAREPFLSAWRNLAAL